MNDDGSGGVCGGGIGIGIGLGPLQIYNKYYFRFNHSSGYFPILLAMYCRTTYNDASA